MTSFFVTMCDAIGAELVTNVSGLSAASLHKYRPWNPDEIRPDEKRHLAVWPLQEAELAEPLTNYEHMMRNLYRVMVWEDSHEGKPIPGEDEAVTEAATATFLDLHEAVVERFYVEANQRLGGADKVWYSSSLLLERPGRIRWFQAIVSVEHIRSFA